MVYIIIQNNGYNIFVYIIQNNGQIQRKYNHMKFCHLKRKKKETFVILKCGSKWESS